jgi:hypothetical protein
LNASGGKVSANFSQWWRVVFALTVLLTLPLTVAFLLLKKPFIHKGFNDLDTDGTRNKHGFQLEHLMLRICEKAVRGTLFAELKPSKIPSGATFYGNRSGL